MFSLAVTGTVIHRAPRLLLFGSIALFVVAGVVLVAGHGSRVAVVLWGLAYGGAATQLQTAIGEASGSNADVANSMLGVAFNLAIFAAGVVGAVLIGTYDGLALPVVMITLALVAFLIAFEPSAPAFPRER